MNLTERDKYFRNLMVSAKDESLWELLEIVLERYPTTTPEKYRNIDYVMRILDTIDGTDFITQKHRRVH